MIYIPLSRLQSAANAKPQGYYDACLAAGTIVGGDTLELSEEAFAALRAQFSPPSVPTQIVTFINGVAAECNAVIEGNPSITPEQKATRLAICEICEFFIAAERRCSRCGCNMDIKSGFRSVQCPEGKWPSLT